MLEFDFLVKFFLSRPICIEAYCVVLLVAVSAVLILLYNAIESGARSKAKTFLIVFFPLFIFFVFTAPSFNAAYDFLKNEEEQKNFDARIERFMEIYTEHMDRNVCHCADSAVPSSFDSLFAIDSYMIFKKDDTQ